MFSITKEFKFDAAHRLVNGYVGKCAHLHGHEWRVRVTLKAAQLDQLGMVMDFGDLGWLKQWIDEKLDHACLVSTDDSSLCAWLQANSQRTYLMPFNPTSENLAKFLHDMVANKIRKGPTATRVAVHCVEVDETCTSIARYGE